MNKPEKLYHLNYSFTEDIINFNNINKAIDKFLSDNFYSGILRLDCFHKFHIKNKEINPPKKRQNILNIQINKKKNFFFDNLIRNKRHTRKGYIDKSPIEINSLSKNFNKVSYKTLKRNLSNNQIIFSKENKRNSELLSPVNSKDFDLKYSKSSTSRLNNKNIFLQLNKGNLKRVNSTGLIQTPKNIPQKSSFSSFFANKFNKNDKSTYPQSPASTSVKSKLKNTSLKSDNKNDIDNDSISNERKKNKIKKIGSAFSLKINNKNDNEYDDNNKNKSSMFDDLLLSSNTKFSFRERKNLRQKIKLKNLLVNLERAERNIFFKPKEKNIKSQINSFKKFKTRAKSASFFNKCPFHRKSFARLTKKNKLQQMSYKNIYDEKSKTLLNNLQKLQMHVKNKRRNIKSNNKKINFSKLKFIINNLGRTKDFDKRFIEQFKKDAVKYQKKIGQFFIYKGSGIYSEHINAIFKGDKMASNVVKFYNL